MSEAAHTRRPSAWEAFADAVLLRQALLVRVGEGVLPRDFAGLYVDDEELDRIAATLPGLQRPSEEHLADLRAVLDPLVESCRTAFHAVLRSRPPADRLTGLVLRAELGRTEAEALAVIAAVELDPRRQRLVSYVQDSVNLPRVTFATLRQLLHPVRADAAIAPASRLRRTGLVEADAEGPWAIRMLSLATRVAWALVGDDSPDEALPAAARLLRPVASDDAGVGSRRSVLVVAGADGDSRLEQVWQRWPHEPLLVTTPPAGDAVDNAWRAVVREATVSGCVVVVLSGTELDVHARRCIDRSEHLAWAISSPHELPLHTLPSRPFEEVQVVDGTANADDWRRALGAEADKHRDRWKLSREQLRLVARAAEADGGDVPAAVRRLVGGHLDRLATRVRPRRGWDDLVLPPEQSQQLRELAARCTRRRIVHEEWGFPAIPSSGVVALFSGPSGTGKTLAAEVIAGELGVDLYKVDLSSVVSKYIGETEKNLEQIFTAAAAGDLVLFFDEADALFGKRSEVSNAHDRYANIEVAYLLQRLETYDGLVVLATNLQRNIDNAFLRRISVSVAFPQPDATERLTIWRRAFPAAAPCHRLDLEYLARNFEIPGGVISNAALSAAFLTVDDAEASITMESVVTALDREFVKLGRLRTEAAFDGNLGATGRTTG